MGGVCMIGIDAGTDIDTTFHQRRMPSLCQPYYGYNGFSGRVWVGSKCDDGKIKQTIQKGGGEYGTGDIVRVEVDLRKNHKIIGFAANDKPIVNRFQLSQTEQPYHLAV